jgi:osmotically-inducible protein OsmY
MSTLTARIEERVARSAGISVLVEEDRGKLVVTGVVDSEELRQTVLELTSDMAGGKPVDDNIDVASGPPAEMGRAVLSEGDVGMFTGAITGTDDDEALSPVDFTDQKTLVNAEAASGPSDGFDDDVSEGGTVYVPPIDPVGTNTEVIGGFQSDSMADMEPERSSDGTIGDEGLADAVRAALREYSTTTAFAIDVDVENRIVRLRGTVADIEDVENAEAVAALVPGVVEVREELRVEGM